MDCSRIKLPTFDSQEAGLSKPVVGLVVPLGYSFNLDGTTLDPQLGWLA